MKAMSYAKPIRPPALLAAALLAAACGAAPPRPVAPLPSATTPTATPADTMMGGGFTAEDVKFMQGMIGHHRQALEMSALMPARTARRDFALMAERITTSQESEIAQMQRWLERRGQAIPPADAHVHAAMGHGELMLGMLTDAEMTQLGNARGVAFEKLFLQLMIKHHEGALQMVRQLYATRGAGRDAELFMLASGIDADQTAEITRMRGLLAQLP
jgi:uncharacterized protein (DUF305 family)